MRRATSNGMTLIEILMVIAVVAIMATAGLPSLQGMIERQHLRGAANALYTDMLNARMEAIRRNVPVSMSFATDADSGQWCVGLSDHGPCDCLLAADCTLAGEPPRIMHSRDFGRVALTTNFSPQHTATFRPARATANAGTASLTVNGRRVEIRLSSLGRARICSDDIRDYPSC